MGVALCLNHNNDLLDKKNSAVYNQKVMSVILIRKNLTPIPKPAYGPLFQVGGAV